MNEQLTEQRPTCYGMHSLTRVIISSTNEQARDKIATTTKGEKKELKIQTVPNKTNPTASLRV
jgi:hypothetical protein